MKQLQGLMKAEEAKDPAPSEGAETGFFRRAFQAAKSGDEATFASALTKGIRLCVQKELSEEYDEGDE